MKLCKLFAISLGSLKKRDEEGEDVSFQLLQMLLPSKVQVVKALIFIHMHLFPVEFFLLHNVESCLTD